MEWNKKHLCGACDHFEISGHHCPIKEKTVSPDAEQCEEFIELGKRPGILGEEKADAIGPEN